MTDEASAPAASGSPKPEGTPTRPAEAGSPPAPPAEPAADAATPSGEGADKAASAEASPTAAAEPTTAVENSAIDATEKPADMADDKMDIQGATAEAEKPIAGASTTPDASKKSSKRKSTGGIPEHKSKKLNKKKSMADLHLDVKPGEFWMARMKSYPPWPSVICDEEMIQKYLGQRPVSAKREDGTYREDYADGGKNMHLRKFPVMFLGTNEFSYLPNTDLQPLDMDDIKSQLQEGIKNKTPGLQDAYQVCSEEHDLEYFKTMLQDHMEYLEKEEERQKEIEAEKAAKKEKKEKRKSKGKADDEDVEMADVPETSEGEKKAKPSKKRKKDLESDTEGQKVKVNGPKAPAEESASKPKRTKKKAAGPAPEQPAEEESLNPAEPNLTEAEKSEKLEKAVLYLRHKLQKGFLTRDQVPKEEEMHSMSSYLKSLEQHTDLDGQMIRKTKIHKVLKAIIKLDHIPKEEEYFFKQRSKDMLSVWDKALSMTEPVTPTVAEAPAETAANGVKHDDKEDKKPAAENGAGEDAKEKSEDKEEELPKRDDVPAPVNGAGGDGDASMADVKPSESADAEEGAVKGKAEPATEEPVAT
ncbi:hypothetical protein BDY21DRAFT_154417 [Lineolata rhizophorae]|uniref:PWWP domain-containing protein n=1 Tax=Lineolata rhizophorae TaxID=578093 RepID=A0A6A6NMH6_9PEZI|nr:hypothetical protein BDY21DRAFT_154417 [Lineolata rhizophorae]